MKVGEFFGIILFLMLRAYSLTEYSPFEMQNDKLKLLKPGSLQHLGENMLAFLLHAAASPSLPDGKAMGSDVVSDEEKAIYFDILVS